MKYKSTSSNSKAQSSHSGNSSFDHSATRKFEQILRDKQIQELLRGLSLHQRRRSASGSDANQSPDPTLTRLVLDEPLYESKSHREFCPGSDTSIHTTTSDPLGKKVGRSKTSNKYSALIRALALRLRDMGTEASKLEEGATGAPDLRKSTHSPINVPGDPESQRSKRSVFNRHRRHSGRNERALSPSTQDSRSNWEDLQPIDLTSFDQDVKGNQSPQMSIAFEGVEHDKLMAKACYEMPVPNLSCHPVSDQVESDPPGKHLHVEIPQPVSHQFTDADEDSPRRLLARIEGTLPPALQPSSPPETPRMTDGSFNLMRRLPDSDQKRNLSVYEDALQDEVDSIGGDNHVIVLDDAFLEAQDHVSMLGLDSPMALTPGRRHRLGATNSGSVEISRLASPRSPGDDSTGAQVDVEYLGAGHSLSGKLWNVESQLPVLSPTQRSTPPQSEDEFEGVGNLPAPTVWTGEEEHEILKLKRNRESRNAEKAKASRPSEVIDLTDVESPRHLNPAPGNTENGATAEIEPTLQALSALGMITEDTVEVLNRSAQLSHAEDQGNSIGEETEETEQPAQLPAESQALESMGVDQENDVSRSSDRLTLRSLLDDDVSSFGASAEPSPRLVQEPPGTSFTERAEEYPRTGSPVAEIIDLAESPAKEDSSVQSFERYNKDKVDPPESPIEMSLDTMGIEGEESFTDKPLEPTMEAESSVVDPVSTLDESPPNPAIESSIGMYDASHNGPKDPLKSDESPLPDDVDMSPVENEASPPIAVHPLEDWVEDLFRESSDDLVDKEAGGSRASPPQSDSISTPVQSLPVVSDRLPEASSETVDVAVDDDDEEEELDESEVPEEQSIEIKIQSQGEIVPRSSDEVPSPAESISQTGPAEGSKNSAAVDVTTSEVAPSSRQDSLDAPSSPAADTQFENADDVAAEGPIYSQETDAAAANGAENPVSTEQQTLDTASSTGSSVSDTQLVSSEDSNSGVTAEETSTQTSPVKDAPIVSNGDKFLPEEVIQPENTSYSAEESALETSPAPGETLVSRPKPIDPEEPAPILATPQRQSRPDATSIGSLTPSTMLARAMSSLTLDEDKGEQEPSGVFADGAPPSENSPEKDAKDNVERKQPEVKVDDNGIVDGSGTKSFSEDGVLDGENARIIDPVDLANESLTKCESSVDLATVDSWKRVVNQAKEAMTRPLKETGIQVYIPSEDSDEKEAKAAQDGTETEAFDASEDVSPKENLEASCKRGTFTEDTPPEEPHSTGVDLEAESETTPQETTTPELLHEKAADSSVIDTPFRPDSPKQDESSNDSVEGASLFEPAPCGLPKESVQSAEIEVHEPENSTSPSEDIPADSRVESAPITSEVVALASPSNIPASTATKDMSCDFLEKCCGKHADSPPTEEIKKFADTDPSETQHDNDTYHSAHSPCAHRQPAKNSESAASSVSSAFMDRDQDRAQRHMDQIDSPQAIDMTPTSQAHSLSVLEFHQPLNVAPNSISESSTNHPSQVSGKKKEELSTAQTTPMSVSVVSSAPLEAHGQPTLPSGDVSLAESSITELSRPAFCDFTGAARQMFTPTSSVFGRPKSSPSESFGYQPRPLKDLLREDLRSPEKSVIERALQQITIDCFYDHSARSLIARSGGLLSIISTMEDHPENWQIQVAGCQALEKLALDEENEQAVSELGGIDCILNGMMRHFDNARVQEAAWSALQNLTCSNSLNETTFDTTDGGMATLVGAFAHYADNSDVAMHASATLANLCIPSASRTEQLVAADGVVLLARALQKHWADEDVRVEISHSLERLCDSISCRSG